MMDFNEKEFKGTDGTVGFVYAWDSTNKMSAQASRKLLRLPKVSG
jgi:hypothetical protein